MPPEPDGGLHGPGGYLALTFLFVALIVLPGLIDTLWPIQAPVPVGEEAKAETERQQHQSWLDGSRGRGWEEQRKRRSRVRDWILPTYSTTMRVGFDRVQDRFLLGRQDWLFYRANARVPSVSNEHILQRAMDLLTAVDRQAAAAGHRLVIVPIPRKASVAAAYLPEEIESRPELEDLFAARLAGSDLDVVDLLPALRSLPQRWNETAYYAGDSHLTCVAMLEMAEAVAHRLDLWRPEPHRLGLLQDLGPRRPQADLLHLAAIDTSSWLGNHLAPEPRRCFAVLDPERGAMQRQIDPQDLPRVGWIGTSFSVLSKVSVYLSHFIGEPVADYSVVGTHALRELTQRLERRHEVPLPEILVLEIPNAQLFDWSRHEGLLGADLTGAETTGSPRPESTPSGPLR